MNFIDLIRNRIKNMETGSVFSPSDFSDLTNIETIKKSLSREEKRGAIRRVLRGFYTRTEFNEFLQENVSPSPQKVAAAIARCYGWKIIPCGDTAINLLGILTQVVSNWAYLTDGPYRSYNYDSITLEFKHCANREISILSYKTALVVQAIKALGKENITKSVINKLSTNLTIFEKTSILSEAKFVTDWIYSALKTICEDKE